MSEQEKKQPDEAGAAEATDAAKVTVPSPEAETEVPLEADLQAQLDEAREQLARVEKALAEADLRAQAEVQNMRRRAEREVEQARTFALEKFAGEVLGVADSLERGLSALDPQDEALKPAREGLELTRKVLLDVFARHNLEQIDPQGQPFNPEQHEAMTLVPAPDAEPNTVIDVLEKGYVLNGRLLRPARVVVSKAAD